jgi:exodeoxyribonuclease III
MKIICWNIAGIRASLKRNDFEFLINNEYDIVCIQESKCTQEQGEKALPEYIKNKYKFRYWNSTKGTTQRKGFSGTCIWSKNQPIKVIESPSIDEEGRVTTLEFEKFIIVNVYTPNSQSINSDRLKYRTEQWDNIFRNYINDLNKIKSTIICGDFNVANEEIDIWGGSEKHDGKKCIGFLDIERNNFKQHLKIGFIDAFRYLNKNGNNFTYWDQRNPKLREYNKGWRLDYYLVPDNCKTLIKECEIKKEIKGSDHCPITLNIDI